MAQDIAVVSGNIGFPVRDVSAQCGFLFKGQGTVGRGFGLTTVLSGRSSSRSVIMPMEEQECSRALTCGEERSSYSESIFFFSSVDPAGDEEGETDDQQNQQDGDSKRFLPAKSVGSISFSEHFCPPFFFMPFSSILSGPRTAW